MIKIIAGIAIDSTGNETRVYRPSDGAIEVAPKLESLWVAQGVATYIDETEGETAPDDIIEETDGETDDGEAETVESDEDIDEVEAVDEDVAGDDLDDEIEPVDYSSLSSAELKQECDERGISYGKKASRTALIALLEESDEQPVIEVVEAE